MAYTRAAPRDVVSARSAWWCHRRASKRSYKFCIENAGAALKRDYTVAPFGICESGTKQRKAVMNQVIVVAMVEWHCSFAISYFTVPDG